MGYVIPKRLKSCFPFLAICSEFDFRVGFCASVGGDANLVMAMNAATMPGIDCLLVHLN